jgi:hypothetical protein
VVHGGHGFKSTQKLLVPITNILTLECRLDGVARGVEEITVHRSTGRPVDGLQPKSN